MQAKGGAIGTRAPPQARFGRHRGLTSAAEQRRRSSRTQRVEEGTTGGLLERLVAARAAASHAACIPRLASTGRLNPNPNPDPRPHPGPHPNLQVRPSQEPGPHDRRNPNPNLRPCTLTGGPLALTYGHAGVQLLEEDLAKVGGQQPVGLARGRGGVRVRGWGWG